MCGIAGIVAPPGMHPDRERIAAMTAALEHRGPDGSGTMLAGRAALGHTRLAILDPVGGAQPMEGARGVWIVYNGEIYNSPDLRNELRRTWTFRTSTDTEVILAGYAAWGEGVVDRLNGMFAFALWDQTAESLLLARDRLGIKPLLYAEQGSGIVFASEMRALVRSGLVQVRTDIRSLSDFLEMGYVPAPHTLLDAVRRLPPAHTATLGGGRLRLRRYWSLPRGQSDASPEIADRWPPQFHRTVLEHTLSDVPVGAFLSGGIDSSLVTAALASAAPRGLPVFTLGFSDPRFDESSWARRVAEHLGCTLNLEELGPELESSIPKVLSSLGEPLGDASIVPTWFVSRLAARDVKVALSGDGGDELFGGYTRYQGERITRLAARLPPPARSLLAHGLAGGPRIARRLARIMREAGLPLEDRYLSKSRVAEKLTAASVLRGGGTESGGRAREVLAGIVDGLSGEDDPVRLLSVLDLEFYLPNDMLLKVDLASMAHGLEVRVPFLDHHLVEIALAMPSDLKLRGLTTKWLLRRMAEKVLPPGVAARSKAGFSAPVDTWVGGALGGRIEGWLHQGRGDLSGALDPDRCLKILALHRERRAAQNGSNGPLLFNIAALLAWERSGEGIP